MLRRCTVIGQWLAVAKPAVLEWRRQQCLTHVRTARLNRLLQDSCTSLIGGAELSLC